MTKRLKETISDIITDTGIFGAIADEDGEITFLAGDNAKDIDIEYYLNHSGDKFISPMYSKLLESDETTALSKLAKIAVMKYKDNWMRIYSAYFDSDYNPIENYSMTETETPNLTDTETPNITRDTTDSQSTNVTTSNSSDSSVHGFNSPEASPAEEGGSSQTISGDAEDNVRTSVESETGTRTTTHTGDRTLVRSGNIGVTTSQQMLQSELDLRKYDFYSMIMNDVDKLLCLALY